MHDVEDFENMPRARKVEVPYSAFCSECFTLFALPLQSFRFLSLSPGLGTAEEHLCIFLFYPFLSSCATAFDILLFTNRCFVW